MSNAEIIFAVVVGLISAVGVIVAARLTAYAGDRAAKMALKGVERQIALTYAVQIAEFRQKWINDLRDAMAAFQAIGIMPNSKENPDFYRLGTKIELLMNRNDPRYDELLACMYSFLEAESKGEKWRSNPAYVKVCQEILKTEWEVLKIDLAKANLPASTETPKAMLS